MAPTAFAGNTGTAKFSIVGTVSLTVPTASIDFGSGSPAAGTGSTIASNAADNPSTWNDAPGGFVVENDGNVNINVKVYADKTAAVFIGGTNYSFKFRLRIRKQEHVPVPGHLPGQTRPRAPGTQRTYAATWDTQTTAIR
ncbi:MAG: hypothetical protein WAX07_04400 [Candidatus Altiarchaeia archaeon]